MGRLMFEPSGARAIFREDSLNLTVYFQLMMKEIIIESDNNATKYSMSDIPVSYGSFLVPVWKQVLLGMSGHNIQTILEVHRYYLNYEDEVNKYNLNKTKMDNVDINYYFSDDSKDKTFYDLVIQSHLLGSPICLVLDIQNCKVNIYYEGKCLSYNLEYLPYKYFKYLQTEVFDAVDSYIMRGFNEWPDNQLFLLTLRTKWLDLKNKVEVSK